MRPRPFPLSPPFFHFCPSLSPRSSCCSVAILSPFVLALSFIRFPQSALSPFFFKVSVCCLASTTTLKCPLKKPSTELGLLDSQSRTWFSKKWTKIWRVVFWTAHMHTFSYACIISKLWREWFCLALSQSVSYVICINWSSKKKNFQIRAAVFCSNFELEIEGIVYVCVV